MNLPIEMYVVWLSPGGRAGFTVYPGYVLAFLHLRQPVSLLHLWRKGLLVVWYNHRGDTLIFCGYIGETPASTTKPKKLLRFTDHPQKIPVLSRIPKKKKKKILELLAYPQKLFIFFMPIDELSSHPYDLSCWWDVKSQINQPTEHVTIQLVYICRD